MIDRALLDAVVDRIVPADADPGALDLGTDAYVAARVAADPALAELVETGLAALPGFLALDAAGRDAALLRIETQPWFAALVEVTQEGFWADPGNGGNRDARSWDIVGYRHGLPGGPMGTGKA